MSQRRWRRETPRFHNFLWVESFHYSATCQRKKQTCQRSAAEAAKTPIVVVPLTEAFALKRVKHLRGLVRMLQRPRGAFLFVAPEEVVVLAAIAVLLADDAAGASTLVPDEDVRRVSYPQKRQM